MAQTPLVPAATNSDSGKGTLETNVTEVEMKVYGKKQADLTFLQRIEKLEKDTSGQAGTGPLIERVRALSKQFGR